MFLGRTYQSLLFLHLVLLNDKLLAYGTKTFLAEEDKTGMATAFNNLAFRCQAGREDIFMSEFAKGRIF